MLSTVDVVIPTYKPDNTFRLLLQKLQEQTFLIQKLIIINTDKTLWDNYIKENDEISQIMENSKFEIQIIQIKKEEFDHGLTRRTAILNSKSDYFICMTQDAVPYDENLIKELLNPFEKEPNLAATYARQLPNKNCSEIEKYTRKFNYPEESLLKSKSDIETLGIKTFFCSNVCAAYKRSIYDSLGGFEKSAIFNEDMIYAGHAILENYKIFYSAMAKVIHSHNYSGIEQLKRNFDLAVSQKQHSEVFENIKSESEGIKMVKKTGHHLIKIKKPWLIIELIFKSGWKFLGYKLGQRYKKLNKKMILKLTMNQNYWKQNGVL